MTNPLQIYSGSNELLYTTPINTGCRRRVQLMTEDSITVKFSDRNKMRFPVGTRVDDFYITKEQQEKYNATTGGYDYELKFDAYYWLWANRLLFYVMPGVANAPKETSFKLTAIIDVHAAIILRCLNALGFTYNDSPFRVDTDAGFSTEAKYINYADMSVLGGIQAIADAYECEWWVDGNAIHFGKCNAVGEYDFTVGENVASITSDSKETAPNRLIVFGSTRNLPANYRSAGASDTTDAIVTKRLMLPEGTPYLQTSPDIPEDEIVEEKVELDSVYPRTSLVVTEVETYDSTTEGVTQTFYRVKYGTSFLFSKDYILPDEELHVVFESGNLNGMDFAVKFNPRGVGEKKDDSSSNPEAQMLEIVVNEDYGRALPDLVLHPEVGDKFSLYGWDSTKMEDLGLLAAAEQELLTEGNKLLAEYSKDKQTYTCPMMWDWCKAEAEKGNSPRLGSVVNLHFIAGDAGRVSRIIGFEHDLDIEYSDVTYICGEKVSVSRLKTLESKVEGITKDGSKVKVQNSLDFLSKRYSDRTPYQLASDMGFEIGNYLAGVSGGMFGMDKTDGQSFAEVFRLYVRGKAYFETLTVIEADTLAGKQYITPGGAVKCTKVEEVKNEDGAVTAYRCYFLSEQDGEKTETKITAGDQAISEMFNAKTGTTNSVSNHRYWRLVTAVDNDAYTDEGGNHYGYIDLSATDCEAGSDIPQSGDVIDHLGNRTDATRQAAMVFSTVDADAPAIKLYTGIGSGETNAEHYSLDGKAVISQGYDHVKGHAYLNCHGDTYIGDPDGSTYVKYDQDTKQLDVKAKLSVQSTIGDDTIEDYIRKISPSVQQDDMESFVAAVTDAQMQAVEQPDGAIETWFKSGEPTLGNSPASDWSTADYSAHIGDLYYDSDTGDAYIFYQGEAEEGYYWRGINDEKTTTALANAHAAQDTADGHRRVFIDQPEPPYSEGDVWIHTDPETGNEELLRSITDKGAGTAFDPLHWVLASKYSDDKLAQAAMAQISGYEYLKEALGDVTSIGGGLMLTSQIRLGQHNEDLTTQTTWAGHNGVYDDGRTIGSWWGGDMLDLYTADDIRKTDEELGGSARPATALIRMDGSAYFANGNIGFRADGSGWLGNDTTGIKFSNTGVMTFGSGVEINIKDEQGLNYSLASLINFNTGLTSLLEPVIVGSDGTITSLSWSQASQANAVRAKVGLYSDDFVSANGIGSSGGSSSGGVTDLLTKWSDYSSSIADTYALSAGLGNDLYVNFEGLKVRVAALENGGGTVGSLAVLQTGSGNAVTAVTYSETDKALTVTKGSTFALSTDLAAYVTALGSSGNYLTWTKNGAVNNITVPFATRSSYLFSGGIGEVNPNTLANGNFFSCYSGVSAESPNLPVSSGWQNAIINIGLHENNTAVQLYVCNGSSLFFRSVKTDAWRTILDSSNYTSTLDTHYVKKSGDTMTGYLTVSTNSRYVKFGCQNQSYCHFETDATYGHYFNRNVYVAGQLYAGSGYNQLVWHAGNDGSGSGLDADLLDGYHASSFLLTTGNAASATKLQTTRTLWGQSFNGTQDVSGDLTSVGSITMSGSIKIGSCTISYDSANGALKIDGAAYTTGWLSANGVGSSTESSSGGSVDLLTAWSSFTSGMATTYALSAGLGNDLNTRLNNVYTKTESNKAYGAILSISGTTLALLSADSTILSSVTLPTTSSGSTTSGDYLPLSGGTLTGNLRLSNGNAYGRTLYFGSTDTCKISEPTTNLMSIYAAQGMNIMVPNGYGVVLNGAGTYPSLGFVKSALNTSVTYNVRFVMTGGEQLELQTNLGDTGNLVANVGSSSDAALKNIIGGIDMTAEQVAGAPSVNFTWKRSGKNDVGSIAQYWQNVLPQTVGETGAGMLTLDYGRAGLLSAIVTARRLLAAEERIAQLEEKLSKYENDLIDNENEKES